MPSLNSLILPFYLTCSKMDSNIYNVLKSVVPSKSYLSAKGEAFHEYLAALSQISRLECCLSDCVDKRKHRRYVLSVKCILKP